MEDNLTRTIKLEDSEIEAILSAHFRFPRPVRFDWAGSYPEVTITADVTPAEDDGWIDWNGGNIPVPSSARVDVKFRNNVHSEDVAAASLFWGHKNKFSDIVAYRVI